VVLVHGGFWRAQYSKTLMNRLAASVAGEGWAAWNIEYRRLGPLGGGGGWPVTFADVAAAIEQLRQVPGIDLDRVFTCGHSAGGHLALWAAARHRLPSGAPGAGPKVAVRAAVSLAGVVDLDRAARLGLGRGVTERLLGGPPELFPERFAQASPAALLPFGVPQVLVHGLDDTTVPAELSADYQRRANAAGDDATYYPLPGVTHREVIDPRSPAWQVVLNHLRPLTQ
jgi:acetyl esterase/lipase